MERKDERKGVRAHTKKNGDIKEKQRRNNRRRNEEQ